MTLDDAVKVYEKYLNKTMKIEFKDPGCYTGMVGGELFTLEEKEDSFGLLADYLRIILVLDKKTGEITKKPVLVR